MPAIGSTRTSVAPTPVPRRPVLRRRLEALRRTLRRDLASLRDRRRILAICLLALVGGIGLAGMWARGELGGSDARAYWAAVRIWLNGGDPYHPTGPFMPYVYSPWLLPLFMPWALLPIDVAWFAWRGATIVALLWTVAWAYRRHPLLTAGTAAVLAFPVFANLDTGNINVPMILLLWAAQFTRARTAGFLWALATAMKWLPVLFLPLLVPRARLHGVVLLAVAGGLTLLTLPMTIVQFQVLFAIPRPPRFDYLAYLWALVPWLWPRPDPLGFLRPAAWRRAIGGARVRWGAGVRTVARDPLHAARVAGPAAWASTRRFFGLAAEPGPDVA
jgi:hypothetical protein